MNTSSRAGNTECGSVFQVFYAIGDKVAQVAVSAAQKNGGIFFSAGPLTDWVCSLFEMVYLLRLTRVD